MKQAGHHPRNVMLDDLVGRLGQIDGVVAVALGGSRARGNQRPDSDFDLGVYYRDASPFRIGAIKDLARDVSDTPDPIVTDFGRWGRWVNGGAWLTIEGKRVDFLYRSLDKIERAIEDCGKGFIESDFYQQPPYGFHSHVYLGELSICRPLLDPDGVLAGLKHRLVPYPQALRRTIINRFLWGVEFDLAQAGKSASRGDVYSTAGCFARCASGLVQVLYALNEQYFVSDYGALEEVERFPRKPDGFAAALGKVLARPGETALELTESTATVDDLAQAVVILCGQLYSRPDFHA